MKYALAYYNPMVPHDVIVEAGSDISLEHCQELLELEIHLKAYNDTLKFISESNSEIFENQLCDIVEHYKSLKLINLSLRKKD